jgi:hypothetical protein
MTQEQLIRLLLQSQSKANQAPPIMTGPSPVNSEVIPQQVAPQEEVQQMTASVENSNPVQMQTPEFTIGQYNAAFEEFKMHLGTFDPLATGGAKSGFTRKTNKHLEDLKFMHTQLSSSYTLEDPTDFYMSFIKAASAAVQAQDVAPQVTPDVDPFVAEDSSTMIIPEVHGRDEIQPIITPVSDDSDEIPPMASQEDDIPAPPSFGDFDPSSDEPY